MKKEGIKVVIIYGAKNIGKLKKVVLKYRKVARRFILYGHSSTAGQIEVGGSTVSFGYSATNVGRESTLTGKSARRLNIGKADKGKYLKKTELFILACKSGGTNALGSSGLKNKGGAAKILSKVFGKVHSLKADVLATRKGYIAFGRQGSKGKPPKPDYTAYSTLKLARQAAKLEPLSAKLKNTKFFTTLP